MGNNLEQMGWDTVKEIIDKGENEHLPEEFRRLFGTYCPLIENPDRDVDYGTGSLLEFRQTDGNKVSISPSTEKGGLVFLGDVTIRNKNEEVIFRLSDYVPKKYYLVEGRFQGQGGVHPSGAVILSPGFMETVGGRMVAIHEIGHAIDYEKRPMTKEELLGLFKGISNKDREETAWEEGRKLIDLWKEKGVEWLPKDFLNNEFEPISKHLTEEHPY